jgi:hypothetical protein
MSISFWKFVNRRPRDINDLLSLVGSTDGLC